jgi:hypothetical protein
MATEDYIPVTGDDWYQRRRDDAEGRFFRQMSDQGPRGGDDDSTRQGIYCLTSSGKLLAYKNAGQNVRVMREVLRAGLAKWRDLPSSERKPGAVALGDEGAVDSEYARTPPEGGLIVNVFTRALEKETQNGFAEADCGQGRGGEAARDHLWLTRSEWQSLVPLEPKAGSSFPFPAGLVERICRFHLVDDTRGEPPHWEQREIRSASMNLTVEQVTPEQVRIRLDGSALLSTNADLAKAKRGYDVRLLGYLTYDRHANAITRFDILALGDHWGEGPFTAGARPGRTPLGIAFELAAGKSAADRVPPQGARFLPGYFGR